MTNSPLNKKLMIESGHLREEDRKEEAKEDEIDQELKKVDGWIRLNEGAKETRLDDFIAVCFCSLPTNSLTFPSAVEYTAV